MIATDKPNPFRVLMLPTTASLADIVSQTENLHLLAETKEEEMVLRWAAEQLRTNQRTRLEYELFELPETCYVDEDWETFLRQHRRRGTDPSAQFQDVPAPGRDDLDLAALTDLLLDELLVRDEPDLELAIEGSPLVPKYTIPLEEEEIICG